MTTSPDARKAVEVQLGKLAEVMAAKDINNLMKLFSTQSNVLVVLPEEDTMYVGSIQFRQQMENFFKDTDSIYLKFGWLSIKVEGSVSWVATHMYYKIKKKGKQAVDLSAWLTGVLIQEKNEWVWLVYHLSLPHTIEAPEETAEEKAASEAAAKEAEAAKAGEAEAKAEEPKEPTAEDVFYELP